MRALVSMSGYGSTPDSVYQVQLREIGSRTAVLDRLALGVVDHDPAVDAITPFFASRIFPLERAPRRPRIGPVTLSVKPDPV